MNRNPILIRNIKHLTDARYFAAMGVDWMSMTLTDKPQTFAMWHTLSDWIAGVKLAAEIDVHDEMLIAKTMIDAKPEGIISNQNNVAAIPSTIQLFVENQVPSAIEGDNNAFYLLPYDKDFPHDLITGKASENIFLISEWTRDSISELLTKGYKGGFCFSGGEEEEVGVRDYELMDELLELIL